MLGIRIELFALAAVVRTAEQQEREDHAEFPSSG
jgi:hypothetical protein